MIETRVIIHQHSILPIVKSITEKKKVWDGEGEDEGL
jgi:hypothetical protein